MGVKYSVKSVAEKRRNRKMKTSDGRIDDATSAPTLYTEAVLFAGQWMVHEKSAWHLCRNIQLSRIKSEYIGEGQDCRACTVRWNRFRLGVGEAPFWLFVILRWPLWNRIEDDRRWTRCFICRMCAEIELAFNKCGPRHIPISERRKESESKLSVPCGDVVHQKKIRSKMSKFPRSSIYFLFSNIRTSHWLLLSLLYAAKKLVRKSSTLILQILSIVDSFSRKTRIKIVMRHWSSTWLCSVDF